MICLLGMTFATYLALNREMSSYVVRLYEPKLFLFGTVDLNHLVQRT